MVDTGAVLTGRRKIFSTGKPPSPGRAGFVRSAACVTVAAQGIAGAAGGEGERERDERGRGAHARAMIAGGSSTIHALLGRVNC